MSNNSGSKLINISCNGKRKTFCIYNKMSLPEFQKLVSCGLSLNSDQCIVGLRDNINHEVIMLSTVVEHPEVLKNDEYSVLLVNDPSNMESLYETEKESGNLGVDSESFFNEYILSLKKEKILNSEDLKILSSELENPNSPLSTILSKINETGSYEYLRKFMLRFIGARHPESGANIIKLLAFVDEEYEKGEFNSYEHEIIKDIISQYDESVVVMLEYLLHKRYNNLKNYIIRLISSRVNDVVYVNELIYHAINYLIDKRKLSPSVLNYLDILIPESYAYISNMHNDFLRSMNYNAFADRYYEVLNMLIEKHNFGTNNKHHRKEEIIEDEDDDYDEREEDNEDGDSDMNEVKNRKFFNSKKIKQSKYRRNNNNNDNNNNTFIPPAPTLNNNRNSNSNNNSYIPSIPSMNNNQCYYSTNDSDSDYNNDKDYRNYMSKYQIKTNNYNSERPLTSYSKTRPPIDTYSNDLPTDPPKYRKLRYNEENEEEDEEDENMRLKNDLSSYSDVPFDLDSEKMKNKNDRNSYIPPRPGAPTPYQDEYRKIIQKINNNGYFKPEDVNVLTKLIHDENDEVVKILDEYERTGEEKKLFKELKQIAMVYRSRMEKNYNNRIMSNVNNNNNILNTPESTANTSQESESPNYTPADMLKTLQDLREEHYITSQELKVLENVLAYRPATISYAFEAFSTDYDKEELSHTLHVIVMKFIELCESDPNKSFDSILQHAKNMNLLDDQCIPWLKREYHNGNQIVWGAWQLYLENHDMADFIDTLERVFIQQYVNDGLNDQQKNALKLLIDLRFSGIINIQQTSLLRQAIYSNDEKIMGVFQNYSLDPLNKKDYYENILLAADYYLRNSDLLNPVNKSEQLKKKIYELFSRNKITDKRGLNILNKAIDENDANIMACWELYLENENEKEFILNIESLIHAYL